MADIPFLRGKLRAGGHAVAWNWSPSPRLRKLGWSNRFLGDGPPPARPRQKPRPPKEIVTAALELNDKLEQWEAGNREAAAALPAPPPPRKWTFADLVDAYRASPDFASKSPDNPDGLAASTRRNYNLRLGQLLFWADGGALAVASIDPAMVADLRAALRGGSPFKAAGLLRMLRVLLHWGVAHGALDKDPTAGVKIPTPPSRATKTDWEGVQRAIDAGRGDPRADVPLALAVAFWSLQRRDDVRLLNRMAWRVFESVDPRDRPWLANDRGEVKGFRLQQGKTGKWVDCPMPPFLHTAIEQAFERSQWLFPHAGDPAKPLHERQLHRACRAALDAAGLEGLQLRDMRRSGMSWMEDMDALRSGIVAISGHQVLGRATILDTYMPPDTKGACTAIATVLRTMHTIAERESAK